MYDFADILGIDPDSCEKRDIRRAYSKLLKQHRPDEDPVGFRRIRDAYEAALDHLQRRESPDAGPAVARSAFGEDLAALFAAAAEQASQTDAQEPDSAAAGNAVLEATKPKPPPTIQERTTQRDPVVEASPTEPRQSNLVEEQDRRQQGRAVTEQQQQAADRAVAERYGTPAQPVNERTEPNQQEQQRQRYEERLRQQISTLARALNDRNRSITARSLDCLALAALAQRDGQVWRSWSSAMYDVLAAQETRLLLAIPPQVYSAALANGQSDLFTRVLDHLASAYHYDAIVRIGMQVSSDLARDEDPILLSGIDSLVRHISLVDDRTARDLVNYAWEIAEDFDDHIADETEMAVQAGMELQDWPFEQRRQLAIALSDPHSIPDYKKAPNSDLIDALVRTSQNSATFGLLYTMHPNLGELIAKKDRRTGRVHLFFTAVILLMIIFNIIGHCTGPHG